MKATFIALLAFSLCLSAVGADKKPLIIDPVVEEEIREALGKPKGELTDADLAKVTSLNFFNIPRRGRPSKITDEGLKEVAKLQKLESLDLSDTQITDAGLKDVAKLQRLGMLRLRYTQVTKAGVAELKKALPKCNISTPTARIIRRSRSGSSSRLTPR